jgi:class 3 adenylate cyclase
MMLAAAHPARVRSLAVINACARFTRAPDYPQGAPADVAERIVASNRDGIGTGVSIPFVSPSRADDPVFVRWHNRAERLAGAPATMTPVFDLFMRSDIRSVLGLIQAPTLVLHRSGDRYMRVAHGRYLAEQIPDSRLVELPGDDHLWYSGDVDGMFDELIAFLTGVRASEPSSRHLATVLFTDIVGSTERAAELGDRRWASALAAHNEIVGGHVAGYRGRLVKLTGDGALAVFDGPARAIHCAAGVRGALGSQGLQIRAGVHTGEVELLGDDVGGIAVHVAARIMGLAGPGELLASGVLPPLVLGSGIEFSDRGSHELKGLDGVWPVVAVEAA